MIYLRQIKAQIAASKALAEPKPPPEEVSRTLLKLFRTSRGG
jgi:hypothetical protein